MVDHKQMGNATLATSTSFQTVYGLNLTLLIRPLCHFLKAATPFDNEMDKGSTVTTPSL